MNNPMQLWGEDSKEITQGENINLKLKQDLV